MNKQPIIVLLLLSLLLSSCLNESPLTLDGKEKKGAEHLGNGVWIQVPEGYDKATSFQGFVAYPNQSSIALQINTATLDDVRKSFDEDRLAKRSVNLLAMRPVKFGDSANGIYTIVKDNRKKTIRYTLAIQQGDEVISIKGFTFQALESKYGKKIEQSLFSVFFGEDNIDEEPFQLAKLITMEHYIMTRDGEYPTLSEDEATIELKNIQKNSSDKDEKWQLDFLAKEMGKISTLPTSRMQSQDLLNGRFNSGYIREGDIKVYGAYLTIQGGNDLLIICKSNSSVTLREFKDYIEFTQLRATVTGR